MLKKFKILLTFYAEKKNLDIKYPLDSIDQIKVKTIRESNLFNVISREILCL